MKLTALVPMICGEWEAFDSKLAQNLVGQEKDGWTIIEAKNDGRQCIWLTLELETDEKEYTVLTNVNGKMEHITYVNPDYVESKKDVLFKRKGFILNCECKDFSIDIEGYSDGAVLEQLLTHLKSHNTTAFSIINKFEQGE